MSKRITQWLVIFTAILAFNLYAENAQELNKVVAIVNSGVITQMDLDAGYQQAATQARLAGITPPSEEALKQQVLNQLIVTKIAMQLAKLNHLSVTKIEIDDAIQTIARRNKLSVADFEKSLASEGINYSAYRKTLGDKLMIRKLEQSAVASSIRVTPAEVAAFIKSEAKESGPKNVYTVDHILLSFPDKPTSQSIAGVKAKADMIEKKIKGGLSFGKAAMKYSDASDGLDGGRLASKTLDQLPLLFVKYITAMKPGQVSAPIKSNNGYHILKLVSEKKPVAEQHFVTQYHVQMIMVKTSPILSPAKAQTHMLSLYNAINNGASFAKIAEANSEDVDSASKGGDLGWVGTASQAPGLAGKIQSATLNKVSKPFSAGGKWYLIKVTGKRQKDDTMAFKKQHAQQVIFQRKAERAVMAWQAKIRAESYVKILN